MISLLVLSSVTRNKSMNAFKSRLTPLTLEARQKGDHSKISEHYSSFSIAIILIQTFHGQ
jgi:hypothetical protein